MYRDNSQLRIEDFMEPLNKFDFLHRDLKNSRNKEKIPQIVPNSLSCPRERRPFP